ncbi:metal-dependent hydrolase [Rhodococcus sp. B7740]|uniref:metal-dependent hydrolase n=1 Tax=Rhodococcus sp. B7740 TaxID=1564114 RepID=UPI0005EB269D|nr:metal-dependent hydrolase [Rhodococcus sp. B7740]
MEASVANVSVRSPIRARRIRFSYPVAMSRHFVDGDLIMSHAIAMLSAVFPEGEDFFVRSVRHYRADITDAALQIEVAGFIGQEVTHGREHREVNAKLQQMGYPTRIRERVTKRILSVIYRVAPQRVSLALTAALEHYTATLAALLLTDPKARELITSDEIRKLLLWHAYEEVEHKSVAFDVYRHIGGSERLRIWTMRATHAAFLGSLCLATLVSMLGDRTTYNPVRLARSVSALRRNPWFTRGLIHELGTYHRRGFHPDHNQTAHLLEAWGSELFGDNGLLAENMQSSKIDRAVRAPR